MIEKLIQPVSDIVGKFVKDKDLQAKLDHELQTLYHRLNCLLNIHIHFQDKVAQLLNHRLNIT